MNELTLETPGKINLYLEVKGKRSDGYHELLTLFYPTALTDHVSLHFNDIKDITVSCDVPGVPLDASNLAVKAVYAYYEALNQPVPGMEIRIRKELPVAGGMGGGSSDAGAVLRLLQQCTGNALPENRLAFVALSLGADVPYFLNPVPAVGRGRGELLAPVDMPRQLPLLIIPGKFPISAQWAYQHWCGNLDHETANLETALIYWRSGDFASAGQYLRNDLAPAVIQKFPLLSLLLEKCVQSGGMPLMSGSGPTLFVLYPDFARRDQAYDCLLPEMREQNTELLKTC